MTKIQPTLDFDKELRVETSYKNCRDEFDKVIEAITEELRSSRMYGPTMDRSFNDAQLRKHKSLNQLIQEVKIFHYAIESTIASATEYNSLEKLDQVVVDLEQILKSKKPVRDQEVVNIRLIYSRFQEIYTELIT